jgi:hypothetical protein
MLESGPAVSGDVWTANSSNLGRPDTRVEHDVDIGLQIKTGPMIGMAGRERASMP